MSFETPLSYQEKLRFNISSELKLDHVQNDTSFL